MYEAINAARKVVAENLSNPDTATLSVDGEQYVNVKVLNALTGAVGLTGVILGVTERETRSYAALINMGHNLKALTDLAQGYYTVDNYRAEDNPPMPGADAVRRMIEGEQEVAKEEDLLKRLEGELDN